MESTHTDQTNLIAELEELLRSAQAIAVVLESELLIYLLEMSLLETREIQGSAPVTDFGPH